LQAVAFSMCLNSTVAFAQTIGLGRTLVEVGWLDWAMVFLLSMSFGLVSLLQRFKAAEANENWRLFVSAHMSGAIVSGVMVYLVTQSLDDINRFLQAVVIGCAGWGGSKFADAMAESAIKWINKKFDSN